MTDEIHYSDEWIARAKRVPLWVNLPFARRVRFQDQAERLHRITMSGAELLTTRADFVEKVNQALYDTSSEEERHEAEVQLKGWKELAVLANKEIDRGFSLLHGHLLVGLWGAAEAVVSDVLEAWLREAPTAIVETRKAIVRMTSQELLQSTRDERLRAASNALIAAGIGDGVEQDRRGIGRFQHYLSIVGIDGSAPKRIADRLFELQQIRHLFAHTAGEADAAFRANCPHVLLVGDRFVKIDPSSFFMYVQELHHYMTLLHHRCLDRYEELGLPLRDTSSDENQDEEGVGDS